MLKKVKIGDKVYSYRKHWYKDLVVVDIKEPFIICSGKNYVKKEKNKDYEWQDFEKIEFLRVELFKEDIEEKENNLTEKNKWEKLLEINNNMAMRLIDLYEKYILNELELEPFYQRELVWTKKQKKDYIMAIFKKQIETKPTIILNNMISEDKELKKYEVLDGKQRITTLFDFIEDKIKLENGKYFSELSYTDKETIMFHTIRYTRICKFNRENLTNSEKVELFLEINELGTKMSDKHIEKIKEEYLEKQ